MATILRLAFLKSPPARVVLGLIILFLVFQQLLFPAGLSGEGAERKASPSVNVTKTGHKAIGNNETITYTITLEPSGPVRQLKVVDLLSENAQFVSANPYPAEQTDESIVWLVPASGNTSTTARESSQQRPSGNGTIENLGIAKVTGAQMNALIKLIAPIDDHRSLSPLFGHGDTIIAYAREFHVDPLLIFIAINESQLCSDNGVVSPGGSNPPNYNCGGITWEAVDGVDGDGVLSKTELDRWHARAQTEASHNATGHTFAFVPSVDDGIGLFFNYVGDDASYRNRTPEQFYDIYNPCTDPGNQGRFACGAEEMDNIIARLRNALKTIGVSASAMQAASAPSAITIMVVLKPKAGAKNSDIINPDPIVEIIE